MKLSIMMGTSVEVWLNLQKNYDRKIIEIEGRKDIDGQIQISRLIDYSYFVKVAHLERNKKAAGRRLKIYADILKYRI